MKKLLTVLLAIGLVATFTACNDNTPVNSGDQVSGEQSATQETTLTLTGTKMEGYAWHAAGYDYNTISVEALGEDATSGEETSLATFRFRIVGLAEGVTEITFDYYSEEDGIGLAGSINTKVYVATVDEQRNITVTEKIEDTDPEEDRTASEEMETLVNTLVTDSGVQFNMPGTSKILVANAPTFIGLSEEQFTQYVEDSVVYEPMISPAQSSLCVVRLKEGSDVAALKKTIIEQCNPNKWICTGAEYCLAIDSGNYILLIMSTEADCNAMKTAFTNHFGADKVGEALTKEGEVSEGDDLNLPDRPAFEVPAL